MKINSSSFFTNIPLLVTLAFTFGLVIGVFLQLPVVSSPFKSTLTSRTKRESVHLTRDDKQTFDSYADDIHLINTSNLDIEIKNIVDKVSQELQQINISIENIKSNISDVSVVDLDHSVTLVPKVAGTEAVVTGYSSEESDSTSIISDITSVISDNIFWSDLVSSLSPRGFTIDDLKQWRHHANTNKVVDMQEGCGRMQNRMLTFQGGSKACARYRINVDQIQGEVFSFYLAQILGITNLAPTILAFADSKQDQWSSVQSHLDQAQWNNERVAVLTPWLNSLSSVYIPEELRTPESTLSPVDSLIANRSLGDMVELMQWSDLIILDYLTANLDRVVNNMYNQQWNDQMMESPTHNLLSLKQSSPEEHTGNSKTFSSLDQDGDQTRNNLLVFLDNESGLFHGYRLLDKYSSYHTKLLEATCVFKRSTVEAVEHHHNHGDVVKALTDLYVQNEPLHRHLPSIPSHTGNVLRSRLSDVYRHIQNCRQKHGQ